MTNFHDGTNFDAMDDDEVKTYITMMQRQIDAARDRGDHSSVQYWEKRVAEGVLRRRENKRKLLAFHGTLKAAGASVVTVEYNGGGDSGWWEEAAITREDGSEVKEFDAETLATLLMDLYVNNHFGGWEINEGADGVITLNVETGAVEVEHRRNVMTQETETLEDTR